MRDYGKVASTFWTGATGRLLRTDRDAQVVALYLVTGPMANMIGLYHLPIRLISDHTGIPFKGASKALRRVCETGFSSFEGGLEVVFVPEMAAYQIGEPLKADDNRVKGIISLWQTFRKCPLYLDFHARYKDSFHLPLPSPFEAPSKPGAGAGAGAGDVESRPPQFRPPTVEEVKAYCQQAKQPIDAQRFIDFYASKGWKVGSEGMKDWQAAVRNWRRRDLERRNGRPSREDDLLAEIHDAEHAP